MVSKKWHFNPCELVKPTKKQFMHFCQLYIIDMHIRHVNYNENYKSFFLNKCVSSEQNFAVIVNCNYTTCTVFIIHLKCASSVWLMSAEVHLFLDNCLLMWSLDCKFIILYISIKRLPYLSAVYLFLTSTTPLFYFSLTDQ